MYVYGNVFYSSIGYTGGAGNGVVTTTSQCERSIAPNNSIIANNSFVNIAQGNLIFLQCFGEKQSGMEQPLFQYWFPSAIPRSVARLQLVSARPRGLC